MTDHRSGSDEARIERSVEAYVALDADWRITATAAAADRLLQDPPATPAEDTIWDALPAVVDTPLEDALREAMTARAPVVAADELAGLDTRLELRASPVDDGLAVFLTAAGEPASGADRSESHRQLSDRLERLATAVSHDLRTPLTVARGRVELAREVHDDDPDLEAAADAIDRMETRIEQAVLLARSGEPVTDRETVELDDLASEAFDTVATGDTAGTAGTAESVDATLDVEASAVRADPDRLQRLLEALIRNAVHHGGRDVTITVGDCPGGVYVADDGRGIPEADRETVFDPGFTTVEDGTGFGLAIVREIATAHGWDVTVTESEAGGARVEITGVERA